jgi:hypothetical protein
LLALCVERNRKKSFSVLHFHCFEAEGVSIVGSDI